MEQFIIRKLGGHHNSSASADEAQSAHGVHGTHGAHSAQGTYRGHGHPAAGHSAPHNHPGSASSPARSPMHHFFFLLSGTVLVETGEKTYLIKEHNLVVIPSGQLFSIKYFENATGYMGGFTNLFISGQHTAENPISRYDFLRIWGSPKIELSPEDYSRQLPLFNRIYAEYSSRVPNMEIIKAYLCAILAEADAIYRQTISRVQMQNNNICNRFLDELFNKETETPKLSVNEYASILSISPNHLNKVVKATTGKSPSTWIEESIILKAKLLLKCTSLPLSEVAARAGILDQSYFARRFRQHEGMTPSEYRQREKENPSGDKID